MMPDAPWGARLVWAWVRLYTAAVPVTVRSARRAELLSDIHEQLVDARAAGGSGWRVSWALFGRMVRGSIADVAWRAGVEAEVTGRDVVLARPGVVLTGLGVLSLPFSLTAEITRHSVGWSQTLYAPMWLVAWWVWMLAVSYGMVAAVAATAAMVRRRSRR